jgi:hypothetical protein
MLNLNKPTSILILLKMQQQRKHNKCDILMPPTDTRANIVFDSVTKAI